MIITIITSVCLRAVIACNMFADVREHKNACQSVVRRGGVKEKARVSMLKRRTERSCIACVSPHSLYQLHATYRKSVLSCALHVPFPLPPTTDYPSATTVLTSTRASLCQSIVAHRHADLTAFTTH